MYSRQSLLLTLLLLPSIAVSQSSDYVVPRTTDGYPDLQGIFTFRTLTPLPSLVILYILIAGVAVAPRIH